MKILAAVLAILLALGVGFFFGRAQGVQVSQNLIANQCEKVGGVAIGNKVYTCERAKKEKKID